MKGVREIPFMVVALRDYPQSTSPGLEEACDVTSEQTISVVLPAFLGHSK